MRTINQGVSVLLTFGSSSSSHLYCGVYFPEKMEDYYNKRDITLKKQGYHRLCAFNPSSNSGRRTQFNFAWLHRQTHRLFKASVVGQGLKDTNIIE